MAPRPVIKDPAHPDYPHGTSPGYSRGCGCRPCRKANKVRTTRSNRAKAQHGAANVDIGPVRERVRLLLASPGGSYASIAAATGLSDQLISYIANDPTKWTVNRQTARYLLALPPDMDLTRLGGLVDSARSIQQIKSLAVNRWSAKDLAALVDVPPSALQTSNWHGPKITAEKAALVDKVYRMVGDRVGPARQAISTHARKAGWHPPICYDDNGVLIPEAVPEFAKRSLRQAERREEWAAIRFRALNFVLQGRGWGEVAALCNTYKERIERLCQDAGVFSGVWRQTPDEVRRLWRDAIRSYEINDYGGHRDAYAFWQDRCAAAQALYDELAA